MSTGREPGAGGEAVSPSGGDRALLVGLFFVSGLAGLIYEVLWGRMLGLEMGNTAHSLATILTVFMGGLALGSFLGGRFAGRVRNGLRVYGLLEIAIGLWCLALPRLIDALHPLMRWVYREHYGSFTLFNLLQFLLCGLVLLVPVTLMGATLPVVAEHVTRRRERVSSSVGLVYAVNTAGAFAGCMLAGLWLLPSFGVGATNLAAVGLNLAVGLVAVALAGRAAPTPHLGRLPGQAVPLALDAPSAARGIPPTLLLWGFGLSGFAAMAYQVAWTRAITLSIGSATYAFTLIVGAFILGLALGAAILGRLGERPGWTTPLLVGAQLALVPGSFFVVWALGELPALTAYGLYAFRDSFVALQAAEFGMLFLVVLGPTFVMGGLLPLVCQEIERQRRENVGRVLGRAYAANTLGTILGAFSAGFVLVPRVGMRGAIVAAMLLNGLVGLAWLLAARGPSARGRWIASGPAAAVIALALILLPAWDRGLITGAPYIDGHIALTLREQQTPAEWKAYIAESFRVEDYVEDAATTVTITRNLARDVVELRVGGKVDAALFDSAQAMLAHLPLILHPHPEDVLIIGLGSGGTLASALLHEPVRSVQSVEISPAVARLARTWFERGPVFDDPRAQILIGDGRLHVAMTDRRYDVILSQPSNPWIVGASALFTRDCFEQMKARLKPSGIACVWMQGFQVRPEDVRTLAATFAAVFEHMDLWENVGHEELFLTGYTAPLAIDPALVAERVREQRPGAELQRLHIASAADLLGRYIADREALLPWIEGAEISTDDHNLLEARIPRGLLLGNSVDVAEALSAVRRPVTERVSLDPAHALTPAFVEQSQRMLESQPYWIEVLRSLRVQRQSPPIRVLARLARLNPSDPFARQYLAELDVELDALREQLHGTFTSAAQALVRPELPERRLVAMHLALHNRPQERWFYLEQADARALERPDLQLVLQIATDADGRLLGALYDLPGDRLAHAAPWSRARPLEGLRVQDLVERAGCRLVIRRRTEDAALVGATEGQVCASPLDGGGHTELEVALVPARPELGQPVVVTWWQRVLDAAGARVGGTELPLEFRKLAREMP